MIWACPACGREFGQRRSHVCVPALSVETYFGGRPAPEREIFDIIRGQVESLGPCIIEPVNVGIFFKRKRNFLELRPKTRWLALSFGLARRVDDPRITRTFASTSGRTYHTIRIRGPEDIDQQVREWITESYLEFSG
ncbi:MAG: hypothetical protein IPF51_00695 [Dehalococcoidia bacterium]|uniref:DUF5655 domain-containing protein n=1 Tax=Candidatus Amarobacter glycogenicus TaxID=3140699 RepID=UPI0031355267|nr:hypothetical protein [Dehalococcoidia bacterium]